MKTQETDRDECAIRHIQTAFDVDSWAKDIAVSAIKKRLPIKPNVAIDTWVCPACGRDVEFQAMLGDNILFHGQHNFCPNCGQAIDWEDE